ATYYRGVIRALSALGHEITFYEPDAFGRQERRDIAEPGWASVVVYPGSSGGDALRALDSAASADVLIKASGVGVFDELLERAVLESRRPGTLAVFWDVDAPATLDRIAQNPSDPLAALIPRYDVIFTYGGGAPVIDGYKALGAKECIPIYNAL